MAQPDVGEHPINSVVWLDVNLLDSNDYNPNSVDTPEMNLLALSMLKQRWIQPILVWKQPEGPRYTIIDGYHRHIVTKTNKQVWAMTNGHVPVVVMDLSIAERMLLTIRINRAKGNHAAVKMHEIVYSLFHEHGVGKDVICREIGADLDEVDTLLAENIFEKKQVDKFNYSRGWVPPHAKNWGLKPAAGQVLPQSIAEAA